MRSFLQGKGQNSLKFFQDTNRIRTFGNAVRRFGHSTLLVEQLVFHSSSGGINSQLATGRGGKNQETELVFVTKICDLGLRGDCWIFFFVYSP